MLKSDVQTYPKSKRKLRSGLIFGRIKDDRDPGGDDVPVVRLLFHPVRLVNVDGLVANLLEAFLHARVDTLQVIGVSQVQVLLDGLLFVVKILVRK